MLPLDAVIADGGNPIGDGGNIAAEIGTNSVVTPFVALPTAPMLVGVGGVAVGNKDDGSSSRCVVGLVVLPPMAAAPAPIGSGGNGRVGAACRFGFFFAFLPSSFSVLVRLRVAVCAELLLELLLEAELSTASWVSLRSFSWPYKTKKYHIVVGLLWIICFVLRRVIFYHRCLLTTCE